MHTQVKLSTAIDESEYSAALKELCSVSVMSSFMNASLLLASLTDYNNATRGQLWPSIELVKDSASAISTRLQRLEMMGVVLVSIQSMIEKLQMHAEKMGSLNSEICKATTCSGLEFLERHYSDAVSSQLWRARNVHVARRIVSSALARLQCSDASLQYSSREELHADAGGTQLDSHDSHAADDASLESARSCSSQAGGYFVDPSVIVVPSGSVGSSTIPLRLNVAGRHEQQVRTVNWRLGCFFATIDFIFESNIFCHHEPRHLLHSSLVREFHRFTQASILRRAYLGRLHREIQGDAPSSIIPAENWVRARGLSY